MDTAAVEHTLHCLRMYVSHTCALKLLHVSSYYYMYPHTTIYVSSYYYICVLSAQFC